MIALLAIAADPVGWGDFAVAVFVVALVLATLAIAARRPPPPPPGRVSARAMRRLIERLDAERRDHPGRQS